MGKRKIAIFTDSHALLEPTEAILEDIKKRGISEIYSLGDNIGLGPNPYEVLALIKENKVKSLAGNYEDHITLGIAPFKSYMTKSRVKNIEWMGNNITKAQKEWIKTFPHFIELNLGGERIALVHFANDVRFDFKEHSAIYYPAKFHNQKDAYQQFLYTNSKLAFNDIANDLGYATWKLKLLSREQAFLKLKKWAIKNKRHLREEQYGYLSYLKDPLFYSNGKLHLATYYDTIIGGHVHFRIIENSKTTTYYSMRALAMGYKIKEEDLAHYIILHEKEDGFDIEEVYVPYDKEKMKSSILSLKIPNDTIRKYTNI